MNLGVAPTNGAAAEKVGEEQIMHAVVAEDESLHLNCSTETLCNSIMTLLTLHHSNLHLLSFAQFRIGKTINMSADRTNDRLFSGHADLSGHAPDRDCPWSRVSRVDNHQFSHARSRKVSEYK